MSIEQVLDRVAQIHAKEGEALSNLFKDGRYDFVRLGLELRLARDDLPDCRPCISGKLNGMWCVITACVKFSKFFICFARKPRYIKKASDVLEIFREWRSETPTPPPIKM